jgi:hypothetical protein
LAWVPSLSECGSSPPRRRICRPWLERRAREGFVFRRALCDAAAGSGKQWSRMREEGQRNDVTSPIGRDRAAWMMTKSQAPEYVVFCHTRALWRPGGGRPRSSSCRVCLARHVITSMTHTRKSNNGYNYRHPCDPAQGNDVTDPGGYVSIIPATGGLLTALVSGNPCSVYTSAFRGNCLRSIHFFVAERNL